VTTVAAAGTGITTQGGAVDATFDRLFLNADINALSGPILLSVLGDMDSTNAQIVTSNGTGSALNVTVGGTLTDQTALVPLFVANAAGAVTTVDLDAVTNVGPVGLRTQVATLDALVRLGDLHLNEVDGLSARSIIAQGGNVDVYAGGDLILGTLTASGPATRSVVAAAQGDVASDLAVIGAELIKLYSFGGDMRGMTQSALEADTEAGAEIWLLAERNLSYIERVGDARLAIATARTGDLDIDVSTGAASVGLTGAAGNLNLSAQTGISVNMIGRTSIDIADEVGLALVDRTPTDFGVYEMATPDTITLATRAPGAGVTVSLANARQSVTLIGDVIDVNLADLTPSDNLRLTVMDAAGSFADVVDIDMLADGLRIDLADPFTDVLPFLESLRIAETRPEDDSLPVTASTLIIQQARVGTGEITSAGPRVLSEDLIINGEGWIRQRGFDMLLQTQYDVLSTFADAQMLAVQVQPDESLVTGVANFDLYDELLIDTDTLLMLSRRKAGVVLNGTRGHGYIVATELQILVNRYLRGERVGIGAFHGLMPWVPSPQIVDGETGEIELPLIMARLD
jgi:hypothetical protein